MTRSGPAGASPNARRTGVMPGAIGPVTVTVRPRIVACGRRPFQRGRSLRALGQFEDQLFCRRDRSGRRVGEIEEVEHLEGVVVEFDLDPAVAGEHNLSRRDRRHRGRGGGRRQACARHQDEPDARIGRHVEGLRFDALAVDLRHRVDGGAGLQAAEDGPPVLVGGRRLGARSRVQLDRMARDIVRELAPDEADRHGAGRHVGRRHRDARHLARVGHLARRQGRQARDDAQGDGGPDPWCRDVHQAASILAPHDLQNRASASLATPQAGHVPDGTAGATGLPAAGGAARGRAPRASRAPAR